MEPRPMNTGCDARSAGLFARKSLNSAEGVYGVAGSDRWPQTCTWGAQSAGGGTSEADQPITTGT